MKVSVAGVHRTEADGMVIELHNITVYRPGAHTDERAVRDELAQKLESCLRK